MSLQIRQVLKIIITCSIKIINDRIKCTKFKFARNRTILNIFHFHSHFVCQSSVCSFLLRCVVLPHAVQLNSFEHASAVACEMQRPRNEGRVNSRQRKNKKKKK